MQYSENTMIPSAILTTYLLMTISTESVLRYYDIQYIILSGPMTTYSDWWRENSDVKRNVTWLMTYPDWRSQSDLSIHHYLWLFCSTYLLRTMTDEVTLSVILCRRLTGVYTMPVICVQCDVLLRYFVDICYRCDTIFLIYSDRYRYWQCSTTLSANPHYRSILWCLTYVMVTLGIRTW